MKTFRIDYTTRTDDTDVLYLHVEREDKPTMKEAQVIVERQVENYLGPVVCDVVEEEPSEGQ